MTPSRLPPMEWIAAVGEQTAFAPAQILVAGCGTGPEAFALARQFPRSTITAVDFSRRSIEIAKSSQGKSDRRRMRFVVADLTDRELPRKIGRNFDFISCHGVLSYVPHPGRVLQNLGKCLARHGLLYLGVNGSDHVSVHWRTALARFGFDVTEFADSKHVRDVLKMFDQIAEIGGFGMANRPANYLAGDLFGPIIHNWPLRKWNLLGRAAHLHFRGSFTNQRQLRSVIPNKSYRHLLPHSRASVHELIEVLTPTGFHRLVLSRKAPHNPPWADPVALLEWRIARTDLYQTSVSKHAAPPRRRLSTETEESANKHFDRGLGSGMATQRALDQ